MMNTLGVGVIGAGHAGLAHLKAVRDHPRTRVVGVAVARPSEDRARWLRGEFGCDEVTSDYRKLLHRDDVDIVAVCSPNRLHAQQALDALAAGKHVLCEKPMVTTVEDARRVVAASRAAGTRFLVGQVCRFSPVFQAIKQLYADGDLGEAFFAEADYIKQSLQIRKRWWLDPREPHFVVFNGGVHPLDLLRWVVGEVEEVQARSNHLAVPEASFDDCIVATLRFAGGSGGGGSSRSGRDGRRASSCIGKLLIAYGARMPYELNLSIYGTRGTVRNDQLFLDHVPGLQDFVRLPISIVHEHPYFRKEWEELVEAIEQDRPARVDALDGARTVALCAAVGDALDTGRAARPASGFGD